MPTTARSASSGPSSFEGKQIAWLWLTVAGLLEIVWAIGLEQAWGWTRPWLSLGAGVAIAP